ncbi:MAG: arylesterase [Alphaproteobacteria bacterium]|nr:arylesterase [Alphaproteobacteria bacterium]
MRVHSPYRSLRWFFNRLLLLWLLLTGSAACAAGPTIVVLGDSLAVGFGLRDESQAFPARLEAALKARGREVRVINAGVSGDTTAGGRSRLDWTLADKPDLVIVELGGNDGLRGIDPAVTFGNLDDILTRLKAKSVRVLLTGMLAPPNFGRAYGEAFNAVFPRLAEKHAVALYPFFLDGVAAERELNQPDGIHPNPAGVAIIVGRILPGVEAALDQRQ